MTRLNVLCWQEIPSVVEARDGSGTHKIELSQKFQELIDLIAMRRGLDGSDDYLMHWAKQRKPDTDAAAKDAAEALAAAIEADYERIKTEAIAKS